MLQTLLAALSAALLVAAATVAARRWGLRTGGVVSAFPAIVGPVLLLVALDHGPAAAARNAEGTLLGLVGLAAFSVAYGWTAHRGGWSVSLLSGWVAAALASLLTAAAGDHLGPPAGLLAAAVSLWLAHRLLPAARRPRRPSHRAGDLGRVPAAAPASASSARELGIPLRMALTALIVIVLAAAVAGLGPYVGGILAALPVLASVLAVITHREAGGAAAVALLRGTLTGMAGFVAFCQIVALLVTRTPLLPAFLAATLAALAAQAPALRTR